MLSRMDANPPQSSLRVHDFLARSEIVALTRGSDWRGASIVAWNWFLIYGVFLISGLWPHPLTIALALVVLGGRQLGLGILMHDCAHFALFRSKALNRWCGRYLCAMPMFLDLDGYRQYHFRHHRKAGTPEDPDRANYLPYPVAKASFQRKVLRDLTGITGIKNFIISVKMYAGILDYELSYKSGENKELAERLSTPAKRFVFILSHIWPCLVLHLLIFLSLLVSGIAWTYVLWPLAYLSTYSVFSRIRNAAEHASVPDIHSRDVMKNTRTTLATWWERLTVAPNYVNFHLEHHLLPHVPPYQLPRMHFLLMRAGALQSAEICSGYREVVGKLVAES